MSKEQTGYPSVDMPQNKYYLNKPKREIKQEQTIYEMIFETNKNNYGWPAVSFLGKEFSYKRIKELTDNAAASFLKME